MASQRINRITEDVKRELSDIFRSLKDPRVGGLVSIVRVEVTGDLSYATVYVSTLGTIDDTKLAVTGLKSASGYIRRELGSRLKIRKVPELRFIPDASIARGAHIAKILNDIDLPEDSDNEEA